MCSWRCHGSGRYSLAFHHTDPRFNTRLVHVGHINKAAVGLVSLQVVLVSSFALIPPVLHSHSFIYRWRYTVLPTVTDVKEHT